jgi:mycothiol system anti-sigma-R factor
MSCGKPHATPCTEILATMSAYVDGELGAEQFQVIAVHISECAPCESEEVLQRQVKALVVRAVGSSSAPATLRARIRATIYSSGTGN